MLDIGCVGGWRLVEIRVHLWHRVYVVLVGSAFLMSRFLAGHNADHMGEYMQPSDQGYRSSRHSPRFIGRQGRT